MMKDHLSKSCLKDEFRSQPDPETFGQKSPSTTVKAFANGSAVPLIKGKPEKTETTPASGSSGRSTVQYAGGNFFLLKNGLIVDGTNRKSFRGSLLIDNDRIIKISPEEIPLKANVLDCTDLVVMPGIIDAHSHMDWYLPIEGHDDLKLPFTAQGVTTFVAGQCGFGIAGFRSRTPYLDLIQKKGLFALTAIQWETMAQYFHHLKKAGLTHNIMVLAGHGTTRTSIRGFDPTPMSQDEREEMLRLLEQAMDEGAAGVSLGLQYEPGIFSDTDELRAIAKLVKRKDRILTVHNRALSALAPGYPVSIPRVLLDKILPFDGYEPHNLMAIDEVLGIARDTGVRLQISHLIFVGERTFKTCDAALRRIDNALREGLDVKFDTYAYHCGQSIIHVIMSAEFLTKGPKAYGDKKLLAELKKSWETAETFLGFGVRDIQITYANVEDLNQYNGMFLTDIAKARKMDWFDNTVDFAKRSGGSAFVLMHRYSNRQIIEQLMRHPASLFMTDALPLPDGVQNPALTGNYPRFFQLARDNKMTLEEAVYKMSGAVAQRYGIRDRGFLKEGLAADITVIDWKNIRDNNTVQETGKAPSGIEAVFVNGRQVLSKGKVNGSVKAGRVIV